MSARGAAAVGRLVDLPAGEARAVRGLRQWCEGAAEWAAFGEELVRDLGPRRAADGAEALDACCRMILGHSRRPLMRHAAGCLCVGADEAVFARILAAAAEGEREDAMLMACLLVRADMAAPICAAAEVAGLALAGGAVQTPAAGRWIN